MFPWGPFDRRGEAIAHGSERVVDSHGPSPRALCIRRYDSAMFVHFLVRLDIPNFFI